MTIEGVEEERRWRGGKLCLGHTTGLPERRLVTGAGATALESKDTFSGETPLIAQLGQYENVKRLLQAGPDPNAATAFIFCSEVTFDCCSECLLHTSGPKAPTTWKYDEVTRAQVPRNNHGLWLAYPLRCRGY